MQYAIAPILILLAAICNACMDVVTDHFDTSIFRNGDRTFYDHTKGSLGRKVFGYYFDFWHLCKTAMLICICGAIAWYKPMTQYPLLDFGYLGAVWMLVFDIFYNKLLRRK